MPKIDFSDIILMIASSALAIVAAWATSTITNRIERKKQREERAYNYFIRRRDEAIQELKSIKEPARSFIAPLDDFIAGAPIRTEEDRYKEELKSYQEKRISLENQLKFFEDEIAKLHKG